MKLITAPLGNLYVKEIPGTNLYELYDSNKRIVATRSNLGEELESIKGIKDVDTLNQFVDSFTFAPNAEELFEEVRDRLIEECEDWGCDPYDDIATLEETYRTNSFNQIGSLFFWVY